MKFLRIGVDLAKNVFQVHGADRSEKPVWGARSVIGRNEGKRFWSASSLDAGSA